MHVQPKLHSIPRRPVQMQRVTQKSLDRQRTEGGGELWGGLGWRLFTGLWRHHYLSRTSERAGDVIPIPMANDVSNCLGLALYGNGNGQTDRE